MSEEKSLHSSNLTVYPIINEGWNNDGFVWVETYARKQFNGVWYLTKFYRATVKEKGHDSSYYLEMLKRQLMVDVHLFLHDGMIDPNIKSFGGEPAFYVDQYQEDEKTRLLGGK